ncbi:unnamed protein product [Ranitomeya imitator]|uniref:Poly [ADP-ribose] polymerase n=1 Tax=Ranitomeya imitator TaxID=111125 RepID=A0ABN9LKM6_9NEOB|nr:unnamed protein product [Ranitomeya imitator]
MPHIQCHVHVVSVASQFYFTHSLSLGRNPPLLMHPMILFALAAAAWHWLLQDIVPVYQIKGISKLFKLCLPKVQCFCDSLTSPPSERQITDTNVLPSLQEFIQNKSKLDTNLLNLLSWILSEKLFTIRCLKKEKFEDIQALPGSPCLALPTPDFLFEIEYCEKLNAKFQEIRGEKEVMYALHGSRLENFHSILHNGLHCHLNKTSLFGEGTYLSSDLSLALLYSPHGHGWAHSILGPILSCVAMCEVIDHPDVKCQVKKKDSSEIDRKRARARNSEGGDVPEKYFVVTNNELLRVKYLLVQAAILVLKSSVCYLNDVVSLCADCHWVEQFQDIYASLEQTLKLKTLTSSSLQTAPEALTMYLRHSHSDFNTSLVKQNGLPAPGNSGDIYEWR